METPPRMPSQAELRDILNYATVALIGMLAGFMVGCLYGSGGNHAAGESPPRHGAAGTVVRSQVAMERR